MCAVKIDFSKSQDDEIPKIFWKYYDLYRRKKMTIQEYGENTGLQIENIRYYLMQIEQK